tara:strand:- start:1838 stop:2056 length:219 start_codon:yes stop_codon:yes gene_type:complete
MADKIDPKHYNVFKIQPRDYITSNNLGYNEGNIIKYVTRWKLKNGIEDLKKAKNYIDYLIKNAEDKQKEHKQ